MANILIMGAGGFGVALAVMGSKMGHKVTVWSPFQEEVDMLNSKREHAKLLPGIIIPNEIDITCSLNRSHSGVDVSTAPNADRHISYNVYDGAITNTAPNADRHISNNVYDGAITNTAPNADRHISHNILDEQDMVILAPPSSAVRSVAALLAKEGVSAETPVVCVSKGLEANSHKPMSEIIAEELRNNPVVMLSGPSHAEEVARGIPTSIVAASTSLTVAELAQDLLMNETLRIYTSDDVLGVEYGGALKNVIALAAGVLDGVGCGDNTKAALMTRGMAEISRLGVALGAKAETFAGLSGMGDLIVTCNSMHSRNRRCGILIGKGVPPEKAVEEIGMTVEGYACAKSAYELSQKHGVNMPIVREMYAVLFKELSVREAISHLMERPKRHEAEGKLM